MSSFISGEISFNSSRKASCFLLSSASGFGGDASWQNIILFASHVPLGARLAVAHSRHCAAWDIFRGCSRGSASWPPWGTRGARQEWSDQSRPDIIEHLVDIFPERVAEGKTVELAAHEAGAADDPGQRAGCLPQHRKVLIKKKISYQLLANSITIVLNG